MMQDVLALVRKSVLNSLSDNVSSGMPGESELNPSVVQLHTNLNFFCESSYVNYPSLNDKYLFEKYFQFLLSEYIDKNINIHALDFLNVEHCLFKASAEVIDLIIRTFCENSLDKIMGCSPTFPYYEARAKMNGINYVDIPLYGEDFTLLDENKIYQNHFKVIFIPVPNNPVGSITHKQLIKNILDKKNVIVVIDEAYAEFSDEESWISQIPHYPQLIVIRSFSKIWGLAGIRMGVTFAQPTTIKVLKEMAVPFGLSTPVRNVLSEKLNDYKKVLEIKSLVKIEREFLIEHFSQIPLVKKIYLSQTNFLMVKILNAREIHFQLTERSILTRLIDPIVKDTLRITIGDRNTNLNLIKNLAQLSQSYSINNNSHGQFV